MSQVWVILETHFGSAFFHLTFSQSLKTLCIYNFNGFVLMGTLFSHFPIIFLGFHLPIILRLLRISLLKVKVWWIAVYIISHISDTFWNISLKTKKIIAKDIFLRYLIHTPKLLFRQFMPIYTSHSLFESCCYVWGHSCNIHLFVCFRIFLEKMWLKSSGHTYPTDQ